MHAFYNVLAAVFVLLPICTLHTVTYLALWLQETNTQGEMTSQSLLSRHDRHFVGITWHNMWSELSGEDLVCYFNKMQSVGLYK